MLDYINLDAVRLFREFTTTKLAELLAAVNNKAAEVLAAINGNGIKSVQRGLLVVPGNATQASVTITAVDMNKAELRLLGCKAYDVPRMPALYLSATNTLTATRYGSGGTANDQTTVSWELTEWK